MNIYDLFESDGNNPATFMDAINAFLPLAVVHLKLKSLPKIKFVKHIDGAFGCYQPNNDTLSLTIVNRHPVDVLRTFAHELVHAKQREDNRIEPTSGETGSEIENEANAEAGVILRLFSEYHPEFLNLDAVEIPEKITEKKKRKKAKSRRRYGYPFFGGSVEFGSDGGGESRIRDVEMGMILEMMYEVGERNPKLFETVENTNLQDFFSNYSNRATVGKEFFLTTVIWVPGSIAGKDIMKFDLHTKPATVKEIHNDHIIVIKDSVEERIPPLPDSLIPRNLATILYNSNNEQQQTQSIFDLKFAKDWEIRKYIN